MIVYLTIKEGGTESNFYGSFRVKGGSLTFTSIDGDKVMHLNNWVLEEVNSENFKFVGTVQGYSGTPNAHVESTWLIFPN